jgi:hypothetical protein
MIPKTALAIFAVLLLPVTSMADQNFHTPREIGNAGGGATFDHAVSALTGAQVTASKGASNVSVKISKVESFSGKDPSKAYFSALSLTGSAPLNKNGDDTDIANLDGLVNSANIELKYSLFTLSGKRTPSADDLTKKGDPICAKVMATAKEAGNTSECDADLVTKYGSKQDKADYEGLFWMQSDTHAWIFGPMAKVGHQKFEFIDSTTLAKRSGNETPWSAGAFVAYYEANLNAVFTLTGQYQDSYKDASTGTICPAPGGSSTPVVCVTGAVNGPKETKKKLLSFDARRDFGFAGIGVMSTYDFAENVFGVEVPVYFIKDKDGKFNAGVKGGWRTDTHEFTGSVVVSSTFGIF